MAGADPSALNQIAIEKKKDFLAGPPYGWRFDPGSGRIRCEDNSVTVLTTDSKFEGRSTLLEIEDQGQLESFRTLIYSKPIVTVGKCRKPYYYDLTSDRMNPEGTRRQLTYHEEEYVMLINTRHPQIAALFNEAFTMAEEYLREGKLFRVTVALSESLRVYFINNEHVTNEQNDQTQAFNCDLYLSHGVGSPNCADVYFACSNAPQIAMWIVCFPCCLVTGVPYLVYKKLFKGVRENQSKRTLPVVYHQGPFQSGFSLFNLLYPPGTTITTVTHTTQPYPGQMPYYQ